MQHTTYTVKVMQSMLWEEKLVSVENKLLTVIFYFGRREQETGKLKHSQTINDRTTLLKKLYLFSKSSNKLMFLLNMKKKICMFDKAKAEAFIQLIENESIFFTVLSLLFFYAALVCLLYVLHIKIMSTYCSLIIQSILLTFKVSSDLHPIVFN